MIYDNEYPVVQLTPVNDTDLTLETVYGRDAIADRIDDDIEEYSKLAYADKPRKHLGASELGEECTAKLWFKFRWTFQETFNGRMLRLFRRGHTEEPKLIALLRSVGIHIDNIDSETGKQYRFSASEGHCGGSCDGKAIFNERWGKLAGQAML